MTEISVDRAGMRERFNNCTEQIDALDSVIGTVGEPPDGGIASDLIAYTVLASAEAAGLTADSFRALVAIADDVLDDLAQTDTAAAEDLRDVRDQIEEIS